MRISVDEFHGHTAIRARRLRHPVDGWRGDIQIFDGVVIREPQRKSAREVAAR
jgi:hypothetical protein